MPKSLTIHAKNATRWNWVAAAVVMLVFRLPSGLLEGKRRVLSALYLVVALAAACG